MPNWCENEITIRGRKDDILEFLEKFKGQRAVYSHDIFPEIESDDIRVAKEPKRVYTFNALCPVPKEVLQVGFDGWHRIRALEAIIKAHSLSGDSIKDSFLGVFTKTNAVKSYEEIKNLVQKIEGEDAQKAMTLLRSIGTIPDGYTWQIDNWGTKWDCNLEEDVIDEEFIKSRDPDDDSVELCIGMFTAWGPPLEFFEHVSPMFPRLFFEISYAEPGCNFSGILELKNGETIREGEGAYGEYACEAKRI